eukprot:7161590-Karenia_brevis.AAC.1
MNQADRSHVKSAHSPQGLSGRPETFIRELIQLSPNDWTEEPQSLMSLGDMLSMAGFPVECRDEPPPRPLGHVPLDYVDTPLPPSP